VPSRRFTFEEFLKHIDDRRGSTRRHALLSTPDVDYLNQLGLDPDVDICDLRFMAGKVGAVGGRTRYPRQKLLFEPTGDFSDRPRTRRDLVEAAAADPQRLWLLDEPSGRSIVSSRARIRCPCSIADAALFTEPLNFVLSPRIRNSHLPLSA